MTIHDSGPNTEWSDRLRSIEQLEVIKRMERRQANEALRHAPCLPPRDPTAPPATLGDMLVTLLLVAALFTATGFVCLGAFWLLLHLG